jgi:tetratricopeptide (TPR) repeat protein
MDSNQAVAEEIVKHANALHRQGEYDEAIAAYRQAIDLMPDTPTYTAYHFMIGDMLEEVHRYKEAVIAYRKAVDAVPHYDEAWFNLGRCLLQLERDIEAVQAFEQCLEILLPQSNVTGAEPFYDYETNDRTVEAWYYVAVVYARLGYVEKAANSLEQALRLRPSLRRRALQNPLLEEYLPNDR